MKDDVGETSSGKYIFPSRLLEKEQYMFEGQARIIQNISPSSQYKSVQPAVFKNTTTYSIFFLVVP